MKDNDGYYYITGRKKEIIKIGGNRVSSKEVEECLLEHENIVEAAVISIPDDILGEAIKAFIVPGNNHSPGIRELQSFCRTRLNEHKIPKIFQYIKELPKYKTGKVNKPLLKEMA
jgi:acyl-coenzyme A synthetase/AMP-(fatty) acid ligase